MEQLDVLLEGARSGATRQIGQRFGLDESATKSVLEQLVPALADGLRKNTGDADGLAGLTRALQRGSHRRYLDQPESLADQTAVTDGNGILGHILGSKDVSRQLAARASSNTGIQADTIKQILPLAATLLMGSLSKKTTAGEALQDRNAGGLLGSLLGGGGGGMLDDLIGLAGKMLR